MIGSMSVGFIIGLIAGHYQPWGAHVLYRKILLLVWFLDWSISLARPMLADIIVPSVLEQLSLGYFLETDSSIEKYLDINYLVFLIMILNYLLNHQHAVF